MQQIAVVVDSAAGFPLRSKRKEETLYEVPKSDAFTMFHLSLRSALNILFSTYASRRSQLCLDSASST